MQLSIEMLDRAGACDEGIDFARDLLGPSGEVEIEWTPEAQGILLGDPVARRYLGWMWHHGVLPQWSMRGADLYQADLYQADLRGADLYRADLYRANLGGANLYRANLRGANLRGADLRGANLYRADLGGADLGGADLRGADLSGAIGYTPSESA